MTAGSNEQGGNDVVRGRFNYFDAAHHCPLNDIKNDFCRERKNKSWCDTRRARGAHLRHQSQYHICRSLQLYEYDRLCPWKCRRNDSWRPGGRKTRHRLSYRDGQFNE